MASNTLHFHQLKPSLSAVLQSASKRRKPVILSAIREFMQRMVRRAGGLELGFYPGPDYA